VPAVAVNAAAHPSKPLPTRLTSMPAVSDDARVTSADAGRYRLRLLAALAAAFGT
jgi:hypothetical protein